MMYIYNILRSLPAAVLATLIFCFTVPMTAAEILRDIVFRTATKQQLQLDIFRPDVTTASVPVVLMIHSGGWIHGDKTSQDHFGIDLATSGILAVGANYRLAPQFPFPKPAQDVTAALQWVRKNIAQYGGDPRRIGLMGESAGAHLVSLVGLQDARSKSKKLPPVRAVANLLGPIDLNSWWEFEPSQIYLQAFIGGSPLERKRQYKQANPMNFVAAGAPAFLNVYATADTLVPLTNGTNFHSALQTVGADSTLVLLVGADHYSAPDTDWAKQEKLAVLQFFRDKL